MSQLPARRSAVIGWAAASIALLVYCLTANPSVTFTDSGELSAVATTLGVAHPTGYPLFTILGNLWTKLPIPSSPVRKLNLFAALCTAASVFLFYQIMLHLLDALNESNPATPRGLVNNRPRTGATRQPPPRAPAATSLLSLSLDSGQRNCFIAFWTALTYAFARTVWDQATSTEVYSLHLIMLQASLLLFLRAQRPRQWLLWAFSLGLAFSNHLTMILTAPASIYLFFKRLGLRRQTFVLIGAMVLPFALGLSLYLYLPLRSQPAFPFQRLGIPEFDWGRVSRGFDKLLYHISGGQYRVWMFNSGEWTTQLKTFIALSPYQLAWIGLVPFALGLWRCLRVSKPYFWFLVLLIVGCVAYAINYSIHDINSYFLLAWVASLWLVGIGIDAVAARWKSVVALSALLPLTAFALNFKVNNHSKDYLVLDYTRNLVDNLEPNAIVISSQWDFFGSAFWYLQRVEGYRRDVVMVEKELLRRTWYPMQLRRWYPETIARSESELTLFEADLQLFESGKPYDRGRIQARFAAFLNSLIDRNISDRPVYLTLDVVQTEPSVATRYRKLPQGFALRLVENRQAPFKLKSKFDLARFMSSPTDPDDEMQRAVFKMATAHVDLASRYAAEAGDTAQVDALRELGKTLRETLER